MTFESRSQFVLAVVDAVAEQCWSLKAAAVVVAGVCFSYEADLRGW